MISLPFERPPRRFVISSGESKEVDCFSFGWA